MLELAATGAPCRKLSSTYARLMELWVVFELSARASASADYRNLVGTGVKGGIPEAWCQAPFAGTLQAL